MAEQNAEGGRTFPLNFQTLLVLLTLASSVWLVSQKLTSTRPAALVGGWRDFVGERRVEARLWEDPFKPPERHSKGDELPVTKLTTLLKQIKDRVDKCSDGLILPVMIPGGPYSEDQESRIRSRFAIVSALGQSGYVPVDAEQIETVTLQWPTTQGIKQFKDAATANPSLSWQELYTKSVDKTSPLLDLRYEWYRPRIFYPGGRTDDLQCPYAFVLWLNERAFESEPLVRLPLLLAPLWEAAHTPNSMPKAPRVVLIGPWLSSTLRAMLPDWATGTIELEKLDDLWKKIKDILDKIDVYSATATAMDVTLVRSRDDARRDSVRPVRDSVREVLKEKIGFHSFQNFVATDDQLAEEMLKELSLRGVDFTKMKGGAPVNHLVLLSEWDTFYARMLWLTYAAKLAIKLHDTAPQQYPVSTLADFIERYRAKQQSESKSPKPPNLHPFFYLRGLDGQTVGNNSGSAHDPDSDVATRASPTSLEDLRKWLPDANKWTPDANKAEGQAQFDYLSRLGEQLATLEEQLSAKGEHIKAIGVVGSDVYDTLLILQALRHRFPNVLFFTTGLDARFWHPRELSWARNLIVTSGYGLTLDPKLQEQISVLPFRDSLQTAQFTAALVAARELPTLPLSPPRSFEIGKRGAVDLSERPTPSIKSYVGIGVVCLATVLLLTYFCGPLRRLTWEASQFQAETLRYREEDVGGIRGALTLVSCFQELTKEHKYEWAQRLQFPAPAYTDLLHRLEELLEKKAKAEDVQEFERCKEEVFRGWLDFLNRLLHGPNLPKSPQQLRQGRDILDALVQQLVAGPCTPEEQDTLATAQDARKASRALYDLQHRWVRQFRLLAVAIVAVGMALGACIWWDTFYNTSGERFSLTTGTSAWPGEILRFAAFALAISLSWQSYHSLRTTMYQLTRRFRLSLVSAAQAPAPVNGRWVYETCRLPAPPEPGATVYASRLWEKYQRYSIFGRRRVYRILCQVLLCVMFFLVIHLLSQQTILRPSRSNMAYVWGLWLVLGAVVSFLFLTLMTIDAARLCRWFIQHLSKAPTAYPLATTDHFSRLRGDVDRHYLDEWIDLQLIAELTEGVGRLLYYPFIVFFLLLLARNEWWDRWPWPWTLIIIFVFNLMLAAASVIILQNAARKAKNEAVAMLEAKVKRLQAATAESQIQNNAMQAEKLLEELCTLRRGAFVPFWENPVLGAVLLPSGGMAVVQMLIWFMGP